MKFQPSRRTIFFLFFAIFFGAAAVGGGRFLLPWYRVRQADAALLALIAGNKGAAEAYEVIQRMEKAKVDDPEDPASYVTIGNNWVLIADLLNNQNARDRAIAEYEGGTARFGIKNTLLILNAGNAYRASGRFAEAEAKYRQAIEANPGDPAGYERLIDLYRFDLKKQSNEIIDVFREALDRLVDNERITQLLAEYLVSVGRIRDALDYYRLLAKRYPGQFDPVLADLEARISSATSSMQ